MWNYTILMLVNYGIPTGSEPGQSSQAGAVLSTQPSEAPCTMQLCACMAISTCKVDAAGIMSHLS